MTTPRTTRHDDAMPHGSIISYSIGFALSVGITLTAFWAATHLGTHAFIAIITAALIQLAVQLVFFLHIGKGGMSRSYIFVMLSTLLIVSIVVGGTLWIMHNLEHLHMPSPTMNDLYVKGMVAPQNELK